MRRARRGRPRTAWIALLTLVFAGLVVLPEAVSASGATAFRRPRTVPTGLAAQRAVVLRPQRVDLVDGGRVIGSIPFNGMKATLAGLAAAIGAPGYLTRSGSVVTLQVALVQRPGTNLTIGPDGIHTLRISGKPGAPAYLGGTGAGVLLRGVQVRGDAGAPASAPGYVRYTGASQVTVVDSRFSGLGRPGRHRLPALELGSGVRATVTGTTFSSVEAGIVAQGSASLLLQHVSVVAARSDGIALRNAGLVDAANLTLNRNGRDGLVVGGAGTEIRRLQDVDASANRRAGVFVTGGAAPTILRLRTSHNGNAATVLRGAGRATLIDATSTSDVTAVRVQDGAPATIVNLTATADDTGISAAGNAAGLVVRGGTISRAKAGVRVGSPGALVESLDIEDSQIGIESGPAARDLRLSGIRAMTRSGDTGTGVIVGGPSARLSDVHASGQHTGLRIDGAGANVTNSTTDATGSGILLTGSARGATLADVSAAGRNEGLRISAGADGVRLAGSTVGGATGLRIGAGDTQVTGGSVSARNTAMVIDRTAGNVTVSGTRIQGSLAGIRMQSLSGKLVLDSVQAAGAARTGLELDAGRTSVLGSDVQAGGTAVDARAPIQIESTSVTGTVGVHVATKVAAELIDSHIDGRKVGVLAAPGSNVTLTGSHVYGTTPVRGRATLRNHAYVAAMPLNWLGVAGIALVVIAVVLMLAARRRERGHDHGSFAPAHVMNRA